MQMLPRLVIALAFVFIANTLRANSASVLSENTLIQSSQLGYSLQYRVYTPAASINKELPVLFVTDGQWYLDQGKMLAKLDRLILQEKIQPIYVVFVDSRNPNNLKQNRRNGEFWCNQKYAMFYKFELIPLLQSNYLISQSPENRGIMGLSFGALNAGCFGLMIGDTFQKIGMQSPANDKHLAILSKAYRAQPFQHLKIYLSAGTIRDNTAAIRKFRDILEDKKYNLTYTEVNQGHNWDNWEPLIEALLITLFPKDPSPLTH